jgi:hypothetical protein
VNEKLQQIFIQLTLKNEQVGVQLALMVPTTSPLIHTK